MHTLPKASERLECVLAILLDKLAEVAQRAADGGLRDATAARIEAAALALVDACDGRRAPPPEDKRSGVH